MRSRFDEQLAQLNRELIEMGSLCEEIIAVVTTALSEGDVTVKAKASPIDEEIDGMEHTIEARCLKLLLQQQPVARDLRQISAALKMITDMERIGDQAYDIAEIAKFVKNSNVKSKIHIKDMAAAATKMVTDSVDSFVKKDVELARAVMAYDDKVDNLFNCVKDELVQLITEDKANGEFCIDLLMIAKYLERIGDHAVNIAEWVEYSITGTHR